MSGSSERLEGLVAEWQHRFAVRSEQLLAARAAAETRRQRIVNLYDRYDNDANATYERVFNSILDTEDDPNPAIADDERDRWLVERTWLSAISTVLDLMPPHDEKG